MNKYLFFNKNFIKLFLLLSFCLCWVSISSSFIDIYKVFLILNHNLNYCVISCKKINIPLNDLINCFRQLIMFVIFPILIYLNISKFRGVNLKNDIPIFCLILYFIFQIPGIIFTDNSYFNIGFIISAINVLLILYLSRHTFHEKFLINFIYLNIFFLVLISLLNNEPYVRFFTSAQGGSHLYTFLDNSSNYFFGQYSPRSTGSSRSLLLIYIMSTLIFYKFFNTNKKIKITFYIIISVFILLFQSRTVIVMLLVFIFFNFVIENNKNIFKYFFIYLMLPIITLYSLLYIKNLDVISNLLEKEIIILNDPKKNLGPDSDSLHKTYLRPIDPNSYSSGRVEDWKSIFLKTLKSKYFGFGAQGDRYLINQTASNGLLYAFSSSGIIGSIFYVVFIFSCLFKIFKVFLIESNRHDYKNKLSSLIILIVLLRSILESSFSVFGIDLIILSTFYFFLNSHLKDKYAN